MHFYYTSMEDIHTIVFILDHAEIPIEKQLLPESARTLNILCNPREFGWGAIHHKKKKDGVVHIDMKGLQMGSSTILEFMRTLRNGFLDCHPIAVQAMEKFAILIGAGGPGCPFQDIVDSHREQCKQKEAERERRKSRITNHPSRPVDDIDHLFYWELVSSDHARENLSSDEWVPMGPCAAPSGISTGLYYYRKRKPIVASEQN